MSSNLFRGSRWTVGLASALAIGAMLRYPGGTGLDRSSVGYSLSQNFLSDLGMTVAYDRQSNRLGAGLFVLSLLVAVVGSGHAIIAIARHLSRDRASRPWARAAAVFGVLACVACVGVAATPENRAMVSHVAFTLWAFRIVPIVAALLAIASFHAPGVRARVTIVWVVLAVLMASYAALLNWGPSVSTADGLVFQVVAQKTATVVVVAGLLFVAREFDRAIATTARSFFPCRPLGSRRQDH